MTDREEKVRAMAEIGVQWRISFWDSLEGDSLRNAILEWTGIVEYLMEEYPYKEQTDLWRKGIMLDTLNRLVDNAILQLERVK